MEKSIFVIYIYIYIYTHVGVKKVTLPMASNESAFTVTYNLYMCTRTFGEKKQTFSVRLHF